MSSLRVRAQNQLLKQLGAAKPSKNVQFDTAHANFDKTHANVVALEAALRGFIISLKGFHISAQVLYGAIETMGGTPENSTEMQQVVAELKNAFVHVDVNTMNESVKKFETHVLRPTSGWLGRANSVKHQVTEFNEEKLLYDHYTRKVMGMREARDKRAASSKSEKPKDVEKLVRNEQKLAAKTNAYAKISDATVTNLRSFVTTRDSTLTPIVQRLIEFRVGYATRIADESKLLQKMVHHDSAYDSVLGALESFAAQFLSAKPDDQAAAGAPPPVAAAAEQPPEPPVQSLSFQSFVGEAPPQVSVSVAAPVQQKTVDDDGWGSMSALPHPHNANRNSISYASTFPSGGGFFDDFAATSPVGGGASTAYHSMPVQPLYGHVHSPPIPPTTPASSAGFTPWDDDVPPPPPPPVKLTATTQFMTMPTSPTSQSSASAPPSFGWDSFNDVGSTSGTTNFQQMHQNAMH